MGGAGAGPVWAPISPSAGSLFHADPQSARLRPRPVDGGLRRLHAPEAPLLAARVGERRPVGTQADPAEGAGPRPVRARVADGGTVITLVAPDVQLVPAVVAHAPSLLGPRSTRRISASRLGVVHHPAPAVALHR